MTCICGHHINAHGGSTNGLHQKGVCSGIGCKRKGFNERVATNALPSFAPFPVVKEQTAAHRIEGILRAVQTVVEIHADKFRTTSELNWALDELQRAWEN